MPPFTHITISAPPSILHAVASAAAFWRIPITRCLVWPSHTPPHFKQYTTSCIDAADGTIAFHFTHNLDFEASISYASLQIWHGYGWQLTMDAARKPILVLRNITNDAVNIPVLVEFCRMHNLTSIHIECSTLTPSTTSTSTMMEKLWWIVFGRLRELELDELSEE